MGGRNAPTLDHRAMPRNLNPVERPEGFYPVPLEALEALRSAAS